MAVRIGALIPTFFILFGIPTTPLDTRRLYLPYVQPLDSSLKLFVQAFLTICFGALMARVSRNLHDPLAFETGLWPQCERRRHRSTQSASAICSDVSSSSTPIVPCVSIVDFVARCFDSVNDGLLGHVGVGDFRCNMRIHQQFSTVLSSPLGWHLRYRAVDSPVARFYVPRETVLQITYSCGTKSHSRGTLRER